MTKDEWKKIPEYRLPSTCGTDAQKWAEAFCAIAPLDIVNEDLMVGWFAACIEHMRGPSGMWPNVGL